MMTDIVERLRDAASRLIDGKADDVSVKVVLLDNAAFEIERLRAAAQLVRSQPLRDQFERWAETDHRAIEPEQFEDRADDNNQYYQDDSDNSAFIGWKAALSSAQCGEG